MVAAATVVTQFFPVTANVVLFGPFRLFVLFEPRSVRLNLRSAGVMSSICLQLLLVTPDLLAIMLQFGLIFPDVISQRALLMFAMTMVWVVAVAVLIAVALAKSQRTGQ